MLLVYSAKWLMPGMAVQSGAIMMQGHTIDTHDSLFRKSCL
jgi:hypothetical protein